MDINIKLVEEGYMPVLKHEGDVCYDAFARVDKTLGIGIPPHTRCLVNLGFSVELPEDWELQVRPRSGLSFSGLDVCFGTVDTNYRGEVKACVVNNTDGLFFMHDKDRICQLAFRPIGNMTYNARLKQVDYLSQTERGDKGFGSSGVR